MGLLVTGTILYVLIAPDAARIHTMVSSDDAPRWLALSRGLAAGLLAPHPAAPSARCAAARLIRLRDGR